MKKRTRNNADQRGTKSNKTVVRRWLRGMRAMNEFTESERRTRLAQMTVEQARLEFDELNQEGDRWKQFGGDLEALAELRIEGKIKARRMLDQLSRRLRSNESTL